MKSAPVDACDAAPGNAEVVMPSPITLARPFGNVHQPVEDLRRSGSSSSMIVASSNRSMAIPLLRSCVPDEPTAACCIGSVQDRNIKCGWRSVFRRGRYRMPSTVSVSIVHTLKVAIDVKLQQQGSFVTSAACDYAMPLIHSKICPFSGAKSGH